MRILKNDLMTAFGNKFLDFQEALNDESFLYLDTTLFSNEILTVITQYGFAYHVGFVCAEIVGFQKPHLRIKMRKY